MIIVLDSKQVDSTTKRTLKNVNYHINMCEVAHLNLTYDQFTKIEYCKNFDILIIFNDDIKKNIKLSRCVKCAWGYVNKDGYTSMQINYWESKVVDGGESRDILIECLIEE